MGIINLGPEARQEPQTGKYKSPRFILIPKYTIKVQSTHNPFPNLDLEFSIASFSQSPSKGASSFATKIRFDMSPLLNAANARRCLFTTFSSRFYIHHPKSSEHILRMNCHSLSPLLTKAKAEHRECFHATGLNRLIDECNMIELLQVGIDVISIPISWNEPCLQDL